MILRRANFVGTKLGCGGKRGRAKIPSPSPFPFCPPERQVLFLPREAWQSEILFKKGSSGIQ